MLFAERDRSVSKWEHRLVLALAVIPAVAILGLFVPVVASWVR